MENENNKIENSNMCASCGGACCKKSGCGYIVSDIKSFKFNDLKALLDEGNISIKATVRVDVKDGMLKTEKILILKARSVDKGIVDLISPSTQCKLWTPVGCPYTLEERPSLGAGLIPDINKECYQNKYDYNKVLDEWNEHQDVLKKLVKVYTGKKMEYVYEEQFVDSVALVLAKHMLVKGDRSKLTLGEQEILDMLVDAEQEMSNQIKEARAKAVECVKNLILEQQ